MSISRLETRRDAALTALDAGDYAEAIKQALAAKLVLATMPNVNRSAGGGSQGLAWNAQGIDAFIAECKQLQMAAAVSSGGIRRTSVVYARSTDSGAYQ